MDQHYSTQNDPFILVTVEQAEFLLAITVAAVLGVGTEMLFVSPSCHPWGSNSRALEETERKEKRGREKKTFNFIAVCCFLQHVMGRKYVLENPAGSEIFSSGASPLSVLNFF